MEQMYFTAKQPKLVVTKLNNGMTDVRILTNEEIVDISSGEEGETVGKMYKYDGNAFRTVYDLSEEEVSADVDKYSAYSTDEEPTLAELRSNQEAIDAYTLQLIEEGMLA